MQKAMLERLLNSKQFIKRAEMCLKNFQNAGFIAFHSGKKVKLGNPFIHTSKLQEFADKVGCKVKEAYDNGSLLTPDIIELCMPHSERVLNSYLKVCRGEKEGNPILVDFEHFEIDDEDEQVRLKMFLQLHENFEFIPSLQSLVHLNLLREHWPSPILINGKRTNFRESVDLCIVNQHIPFLEPEQLANYINLIGCYFIPGLKSDYKGHLNGNFTIETGCLDLKEKCSLIFEDF